MVRTARAATSAGSYLRLKSLVISIASGSVPETFGRMISPEQAFVGMIVQVEQARQNQVAGRHRFHSERVPGSLGRNGGNLFSLDRDIDSFLLAPHAGVTDDQIHDPVLMLSLPALAPLLCAAASCSLENMQPARAVDQVNEAAVVEAHVVALHPRCPRWNVRHE